MSKLRDPLQRETEIQDREKVMRMRTIKRREKAREKERDRERQREREDMMTCVEIHIGNFKERDHRMGTGN